MYANISSGAKEFIRFRCPNCDRKVRVCGAAAGKRGKCKCGASIAIPASWQVPKNKGLARTVLELGAVRLYPVARPAPRRAARPPVARLRLRRKTRRYRQALAVAASSILMVALAGFCVLGLKRACSNGPEINTTPCAPAKAETKANTIAMPAPPKEAQPKTPPTPQDQQKAYPKAATHAKKAVPDKNSAASMPVGKTVNKLEIIEWYTVSKVSAVGDSGKKEVLFLNESDLNAGTIFVAIKVRLPAQMLKGRQLTLPDADIKLRTTQEDVPAFGCGMRDGQWFAPEKGVHAYETDGKQAVQSWLFETSLNDLESGRAQLQFGDLPAQPITPKLRVSKKS